MIVVYLDEISGVRETHTTERGKEKGAQV